MPKLTPVIIVGAGLSGLATAYRLNQAGIQSIVLEADHCAGGRIKPAAENSHQDLGPSWVWPQAQPLISDWLDELSLTLFEQFDSGNALLDTSKTGNATQQQMPTLHGSMRITGGTHALISALEARLNGTLKLNHQVIGCTKHNNLWQLTVSSPGESINTLTASKLVIATPPRLAAPLLPSNDSSLQNVITILAGAETWMAPHAKIVVFYKEAFWRNAGLSGRIMSHVGPLVEVYDHCAPDGSQAALFGFAGVPAAVRAQYGDQFQHAIKQQLQRCFGEAAPDPERIVIQDWAQQPFTATIDDHSNSGAHPPVLAQPVRDSHSDHSLWFAGSETSFVSPGLIEGALARADKLATQIEQAAD